MTNWLDRIKKVRKTVNKLKRKADTKLEKAKLNKVNAKADEVKKLDKRLKELRKEEKTATKREEIYKLEKKLTTSGKLLTSLENGAKFAIEKGGKLAKEYSKNKGRKRKSKKESDNFWG